MIDSFFSLHAANRNRKKNGQLGKKKTFLNGAQPYNVLLEGIHRTIGRIVFAWARLPAELSSQCFCLAESLILSPNRTTKWKTKRRRRRKTNHGCLSHLTVLYIWYQRAWMGHILLLFSFLCYFSLPLVIPYSLFSLVTVHIIAKSNGWKRKRSWALPCFPIFSHLNNTQHDAME